MKFIKLEILNLASLDRQGGETICFEEGALGDSTIFSIVGPTGSGKSTILDAICLALYNRAPRYPRKKGDRGQGIEIYGTPDDDERNRLPPTDCRNILTRGKKEGYSKLTFLANNGTVYRAEWHVKFLRRRYDDAITTLYKITTVNGKPAEEETNRDELPAIIGLDYDQFLRTVLIAQGAFANFLTAKENERCTLLEHIIGCENMYAGIAAKIKQKKDEATSAYATIAASLSAQEKDILPEEALQTLTDRVAALEAEEQKVKAELKKVTEALGWYATEETFCADMAKHEAACQRAKANIDAVSNQATRLQLHDTAAEALSYYKDMKTAESNMARLETLLDKLRRDICGQEQAIGKEDAALNALMYAAKQAAEELERQKPHINKAREIAAKLDAARKAACEKAKAQVAAETAKARAQEEADANAAATDKALKALDNATDKQASLQQETESHCKQLRERAGKAAALYDEANQRLEKQDATLLQQAKSAAEQQQADLKTAIRTRKDMSAKQDRSKCLTEQQQQLGKSNEAIDAKLKDIHTESLAAEIDTLTKTYTLMTSDNWTLHRHHLADGEPCPLCGSTVHPYHDDSVLVPVVGKLKTLIGEKRATLDSLVAQKQQLTQERGKNDGLLDGIRQSLDNLSCECRALYDEWQGIAAKHEGWPEDCALLQKMQDEADRRAEAAAKEVEAYNALAKHVALLRKDKDTAEREERTYTEASALQKQKAEKAVAEAHTVLETERGKTAFLKKQCEEKCEALTKATEEATKARTDVEEKTLALRKEIGDHVPDIYEQTLTMSRDRAAKAVDEKKGEIARMREQLNATKGSEQATMRQRQAECDLLAKAKEALDQWLAAYNDDPGHPHALSAIDIAMLHTATDDWDGMRAMLKRLGDAMTSAATTLRNSQRAHDEHQKKKPETTREQLEARREQLEATSHAELVDAKARLQRHEAAKRQAGDMVRQKQDAEQLKCEWEQIADAVGADGKTLRKVAQCYTLRFLIEHANAEIRKFNDRYELQQVRHSLGIRVIDHDRADDVRDTTSLSGGETFIVSLGLALGLSALSSRNISFDNLFIDEGFGTLDPDTLATVIDSLAMLQSSQGKKVGVISHTDTMSERITTQIRIIKNGNSGSSHIEIYP